jgi:hypothetical protein
MRKIFEKVLVLSTAHISKQTNDFLKEVHHDKLEAFRFVAHSYGFILFVSEVSLEEDRVNDWKYFPELRPIMEMAVKYRCSYINIDRDGEVDYTGQLQTFEW